jgi:hypothetical protein
VITPGFIEFKYRKDSKKTNRINGEFKFIVNGEKIIVDHNYENNDWIVYNYTLKHAPSTYNIEWIYTKYNVKG